MTVFDPEGNAIEIPEKFLGLRASDSDEIFDDIRTVIERPMLLFKGKEEPVHLYYLRAVGWSTVVLVTAIKRTHFFFEVVQLDWDPSCEQMAAIYDKAIRLK